MPLDHIGEGGFEGVPVEGTANAQCEREIVARALSFGMVEEPKAILRERKRDHLWTWTWPKSRSARHLGLVEPFSEPGDGGNFEQRTKWQLELESSTDFWGTRRHGPRMTPGGE